MPYSSSRIHLIDALRGLSVLLMVIHHFLFDLVAFLDAPLWLFSNPLFDFLHYLFAGLFILLSGISSRFSKSNIKRSLFVIAAALAISIVTALINMPIFFGILHFLGFSMLLFGLTGKYLSKFTSFITPFIYILLLIASQLFLSLSSIQSRYLWFLGITYPDFYSADYFPIFPWIFVFLLGTWCGGLIKRGKLPDWFYISNPPILPAIGRKAFIIYLLHQPLLYALTLSIRFFI